MLVVNKILTVSGDQMEMVIHGMRNPMESWDKSDSYIDDPYCCGDTELILGDADQNLMHRLYEGGPEHRKYDRMMPIWIDMTAPMYWWKEFDTYKVGTVRNSCSTMHRIHVHPIDISLFSADAWEELGGEYLDDLERYLKTLDSLRKAFNKTGDRIYWRALIQGLPDGFNMRATVMISYENYINIEHQRKGHKLVEWAQFLDQTKDIPYMDAIREGWVDAKWKGFKER